MKETKYLFILYSNKMMKEAKEILKKAGVIHVISHDEIAITGYVKNHKLEFIEKSDIFALITSNIIGKETQESLGKEYSNIVKLWNHGNSTKYIQNVKKDFKDIGVKWNDKKKSNLTPSSLIDQDLLKEKILSELKFKSESELIKKSKRKRKLTSKEFVALEKKIGKKISNPTWAYHISRSLYRLPIAYLDFVLVLPDNFWDVFFIEPSCWKLEGDNSLGILIIESEMRDGPRFSNSDRNTIEARICDGLEWLIEQSPEEANLSFSIDWQRIRINTPNGDTTSDESYWRNPAIGNLSYEGNSYTSNLDGVNDYREDLRLNNRSNHAFVLFVTPYATDGIAYAYPTRRTITLTNQQNWAGWGINKVDVITAHEVLHIFGAADEYTGEGTPCSTCGTMHGCYQIPNGNCGECAEPSQKCVMDANDKKICAYTQGHIGWADLFVELHTGNRQWAGTDDKVWLDIGDRTFELDTKGHNDRERNNVEGYALNYTGVQKEDIKRIGIRKSSDGFSGGWFLERVKVWCQGELICNKRVNQWLEDDNLWWVSSDCGNSDTIINEIEVRVTTADVWLAGTDNNVTLELGNKSWKLDKKGRNDFERGNTDLFYLDPGVSFYENDIDEIKIRKSRDGIAGGWKLEGLRIRINGSNFYNNQNIDKWLEDDDRSWRTSV